MQKTFINRQPIHDAAIHLRGYQMVSQPRLDPDAFGPSALKAELATFTDVGLDQIAGDQIAFVPIPRRAVLGGFCDMLPRQRVVLQLKDDVVNDPPLRRALSELAGRGFRIAVTDPRDGGLERLPGRIADYVRVDVAALAADELKDRVGKLAGTDVKLLADRVADYETFERVRDLKFDLYQGPFFCEPREDVHEVPVNRAALVRLMSRLQDPDLSIDQLEETISHDLTLSYKLLRYANSAYIGLNRNVESIGHAAKMVGLERIRLWASLLMLSKLEDKPRELMMTAIVRAAMCERLGASSTETPREVCFTVGLLSVLDALLDRPMQDALDQLPLSERVNAALLRWEGESGEALRCAIAYERGRWDEVRFGALKPMAIRGHYLDSLGWARRISEGLMI